MGLGTGRRDGAAECYTPRPDPMRLSPDEINYISRKIVKVLTADRRIEVDDAEQVINGIARVIVEDLQIEDRLNEAVREVLIQHSQQMDRSDIAYSDMFKKVKRELAKQKGIIL